MTPSQQKLVDEFNAIPGTDGAKRNILGYDSRYSQFGIHFGLDNRERELPPHVKGLRKAGFIAIKVRKHRGGSSTDCGFMATTKGKRLADLLNMNEGKVILHSRYGKNSDGQTVRVEYDTRVENLKQVLVAWSDTLRDYVSAAQLPARPITIAPELEDPEVFREAHALILAREESHFDMYDIIYEISEANRGKKPFGYSDHARRCIAAALSGDMCNAYVPRLIMMLGKDEALARLADRF